MDDKSDPEIVNRLKGQPPYPEDVLEETQEAPQEDVQEEVQEESPEEQEALDNSKNPERTKKYIDKLTAERDRAREEARAFENGMVTPGPLNMPQVPQFNPNNFPNLTQTEIRQTEKQLFDDNGYVDKDLLQDLLSKANQEARAAREEATRLREEMQRQRSQDEHFSHQKQVERVHKKFPELDPNSKDFNPRYFEAVRDRMVSQLATTGRRDFYQAAKDLRDVYNTAKVNKKEEAIKKQNQLRNINASSGGGTSSQRSTPEEHEALVQGTIKGAKGALAARLKASGY